LGLITGPIGSSVADLRWALALGKRAAPSAVPEEGVLQPPAASFPAGTQVVGLTWPFFLQKFYGGRGEAGVN